MEEGFSTPTSSSAPSPTPSPAPAPSTPSTPTPSASSTSSSQPSSNPTPSNESHTQPNPQQSQNNGDNKVIAQAGRQQLVVDAFGRRVVKFNNNNSAPEPTPQGEQTEGTAGQPKEEPAPQAQPFTENIDEYVRANNIQPEKYNLDEFSSALASGNVDERRVPDQYRSQYENFKINQAMQQYTQNQKALEEQRKAQVEEQLTPEQKAENMAQFYSSLDKEARERAIADVNLSQEDVENLPYMDEDDPKLVNYKLAKEFHKQQIMADLQSRAAADRAKREAQAQVYNNIQAFVSEMRIKEPNFDAIDIMMKERYKTLPYAEGQKIAEVINALNAGTITEAQSVELKRYFDMCRREHYANKNGLSTQPQQVSRPPVLERPGGNAAPPAQYVPDYNALRNANGPRERREWVMQFMRAKANRNR